MENSAWGVLIAAAGPSLKGSAAKSLGPKALWPILDKPMMGYLLKTILECDPEGAAAVVDSKDDATCEYLKSFPSVTPIRLESSGQSEWYAVRYAGKWLERFNQALVLRCDLPFLGVETVLSFMRRHLDSGADCSFLGDAPYALAFDTVRIASIIEDLSACHFSDLAWRMSVAGLNVRDFALNACEASSIHDQAGLAEAAARMRNAIVLKWMANGVRVMDPHAVWIGPDVELAPGVSLMPGVQIWGNSFVGEGSVVGPYCVLRNARLGRGVNLISNVIVEDSELRDQAKAGPFAYIREGSLLHERSFAGKFVEIKKTSVGTGSKVPHLSYMGDAVLGENVNIGAGSVTCNYDGTHKHKTKIGDRCFVGSDTMMVAPVTLGDDSMTAAGSTITADVPAGALAVGRARQKNLEGRALNKKQVAKQ